MMRQLRIWWASRKLEKLIRARRDSFECEQYRRHRQAALKHTRATA